MANGGVVFVNALRVSVVRIVALGQWWESIVKNRKAIVVVVIAIYPASVWSSSEPIFLPSANIVIASHRKCHSHSGFVETTTHVVFSHSHLGCKFP